MTRYSRQRPCLPRRAGIRVRSLRRRTPWLPRSAPGISAASAPRRSARHTPSTFGTPEPWTLTISFTTPSGFCRIIRTCSRIIREDSATFSSMSIRTQTIYNISLPHSWRAAAETYVLSATTIRAFTNSAARRSKISSPLKNSIRRRASSGLNRITARPETSSPRQTPLLRTTVSERAKRSGRRSPAAIPLRCTRRTTKTMRRILSPAPSAPRAAQCAILLFFTGRTRSRAASSLRSSAAQSRTGSSAARAFLTARRSRTFWHIST